MAAMIFFDGIQYKHLNFQFLIDVQKGYGKVAWCKPEEHGKSMFLGEEHVTNNVHWESNFKMKTFEDVLDKKMKKMGSPTCQIQ